MHYDLRHIAAYLRAFYSLNGLLIGATTTLAFLFWLANENNTQSHKTRDSATAVAPNPHP